MCELASVAGSSGGRGREGLSWYNRITLKSASPVELGPASMPGGVPRLRMSNSWYGRPEKSMLTVAVGGGVPEEAPAEALDWARGSVPIGVANASGRGEDRCLPSALSVGAAAAAPFGGTAGLAPAAALFGFFLGMNRLGAILRDDGMYYEDEEDETGEQQV